MSRLLQFARENGWPQLVQRVAGGFVRRVRDGFTARKLRAPGFRAGRFPRLLGLSHMCVGSHFSAGDGLWLEAVTSFAGEQLSPSLTIGDHVSFSDSVHVACAHSISIGDGTLIGSRVLLSDHAHGSYGGDMQSGPDTMPVSRPLHSPNPVVVGKNVWIGDGVAVLPGADIGDGAIIGASSVVNGSIPPGTIAVGAPARAIRRWDPECQQWVRVSGT